MKPDYWRDEVVASLSDSVARFYIGMWQVADDGGWLQWNVSEIALDLYGYQPRKRRERWVEERGRALEAVGRLVFHECGHVFVPKLTKHQKFGGRPVFSVRDAHARDCAPLRADAPHGIGKVGKGRVRKGSEISSSNDDQLATVLGPERLERIRRRSGAA